MPDSEKLRGGRLSEGVCGSSRSPISWISVQGNYFGNHNTSAAIFSPLPVSFVKGEGLWLTDTEGKRYLGRLCRYCCEFPRHNHPVLVKALKDQVEHLIHCSNYFRIDLQETVAAKLCEKSGLRGCFFCNSGLEANEAAIKLARKYGHMKGFAQPKIIVFQHAFHGRSIASLSATGNPGVRRDFDPYLPDFIFVPDGDVAAIEKVAASEPGIAAVMFEPVQGEAVSARFPLRRCAASVRFATRTTGS